MTKARAPVANSPQAVRLSGCVPPIVGQFDSITGVWPDTTPLKMTFRSGALI